MHCKLALVVLLSLSHLNPISSQGPGKVQWPQFRGAGGAGVAPEGMKLPTNIGPEKKPLWKTAVPPGHSSPCIWEDRLFLTSADKAAKKLETLCLDRKTGAVRWRHSVVADTLETIHQLNSHASSTPTTDGERVYAYFGSFGLVCYDLEGKEVWKTPMAPVPGRFGSATSPVVAGERLLLQSGKANTYSLLALDCKTGKVIWQKERPRGFSTGLYSSPAVYPGPKGPVALSLGGAQVAAYDLMDGTERWHMTITPSSSPNSPVVSDGLAVFSISNPIGDPDNIIALPAFSDALKKYDKNGDGVLELAELPADLNTFSRGREDKVGDWSPVRDGLRRFDRNRDGKVQEEEWKAFAANLDQTRQRVQFSTYCVRISNKEENKGPPEILWKQIRAVPEVPSPLIYQERVYLLSEKGILTCRELKTGKELYQSRLPVRGTCYSSPVACDGKIYLACDRGSFLVLQAGPTLQILEKTQFPDGILATPALVDDKMYLRTESTLWAFGD